MAATDPSAHSSDDKPGSILVNDTMGAFAELLQGIQLSEARAAAIIVAVHKITMDTSLTQRSDLCGSPLDLPTSANPACDIPSTREATPVPDQPEAAPEVLSGHCIIAHKGINFVLPLEGEDEPFYLITGGKMVGVFSKWENASRMVDRVSSATYRWLPSGTVISQARQMVVMAIDNGVVSAVGTMPPASVVL